MPINREMLGVPGIAIEQITRAEGAREVEGGYTVVDSEMARGTVTSAPEMPEVVQGHGQDDLDTIISQPSHY